MTTLNQDVQVKYGAADITHHVISYERSQKMCTSVDTLNMVLTPGSGGNFHPWDRVKIFEGGSLKGTYYLNDSGVQQPDGSWFLSAQDNSKRLVDYFITDTYTIDYPSYARDWIELFLNEVGLTFRFTTEDSGSMLSNNTALGLMSAYEQIQFLIQISGWYLYFDKTGMAIIGEIEPDLGSPKGSITKRQLTSYKVITHDKMLRNRVVVWGATDPVTSGTIFSDVSTITPWNYDSGDLRAIVIENSYIPTQADADNIAMMALNSFARITVEKHLEIPEEKGWEIGDAVRALGGVGVVTTQGAHFSASTGYRTDIILDERCPRLWAFFDMGGYVYIGTETSGVYRKHIKYDTVWSSFNEGLPESDYGISDLFVRGGMESIVCMSGNAYYNIGSGYPETWGQILIPPLETVMFSGGPHIVESGIKSRAIIHDKVSNNIRLLVDTYSGNNFPGYFELVEDYVQNGMIYSGEVGSGYWVSPVGISGCRTWVLDYSTSGNYTTSGEYPATYDITDESFSGMVLVSSYPVYFSGIDLSGWDCRGIDIENDGRNDYVSVIGQMPQAPNELYSVFPAVYMGYYMGSFGKFGRWGENFWTVEDNGSYMLLTWLEYRPIPYAFHKQWIMFKKVEGFGYSPNWKDRIGQGFPVFLEGDGTWGAWVVSKPDGPCLADLPPELSWYKPADGDKGLPRFWYTASVYKNEIQASDYYWWESSSTLFCAMRGLDPGPPYENSAYFTAIATPFNPELPAWSYAPCRVLRRDGNVFSPVTSGLYPIRLDISSVSPLVTVQDKAFTFNSFYPTTSGEAMRIAANPATVGINVNVLDFRYASFMNTTVSGVTLSGYKEVIFTTPSGILTTSSGCIFLTPVDSFSTLTDASVLTSGIPVVLSGNPGMIETSNFAFPNQYVFVSTSGEVSRFYQKDPSGLYSMSFVEYPSGLPNSRITMIRLEDII